MAAEDSRSALVGGFKMSLRKLWNWKSAAKFCAAVIVPGPGEFALQTPCFSAIVSYI